MTTQAAMPLAASGAAPLRQPEQQHGEDGRQLLRGAGSTLLLRIAGGGLELALNLLVARALGAAGVGAFYLALTFTTIGSVIARLGLDNSLLRLAAAHAAAGQWGLVRSAARRGLLAAGAVSLLFTAAIECCAAVLAAWRPDLRAAADAMRIMAWAVAPLSLVCLYGELLKALRRVVASQLVAAVAIPGIAVAAIFACGTRYGAAGPAAAYLLAALCAALFGAQCWRRALPPRSVADDGPMPWPRLFAGTGFLLWIKSMRMASPWLATGVLAVQSSTAEVGVFNVALRVSLVLGLLMMAVDSVVAPRFAAELHDRDRLQRLARRATALACIAGGLVLLPLLLAAPRLMGWFGAEFGQRGALVLMVLALGQAINLLTGPVNMLLMMGGCERQLSRCVSLSVLAGLLALLLLAPRYGAVGAAAAVSLAMAVQNLGAAWVARQRLGVITLPLWPRRRGRSPA